MIFVTVGTHEQPFDRLIKYMDHLKRDGLQEEVFMQTGYSAYQPQYCEWGRIIPYHEMEKRIAQARIIITHGGPASFIQALQAGKTPIVVPRQSRYGEHVNDHQTEFVREVAERMGTIIPIYEIEELGEAVGHYDELAAARHLGQGSHNREFNRMFGILVEEMFQGGRVWQK